MFQELARTANVDQTSESNLSDDGTELATSSRHTVRGRAVSGGEDLSRDDESRAIWTEVLEEVGEAVEEDEGALALGGLVHGVEAETL